MYFPSDSWGKFKMKPNKNVKILERIRLLYNLALNGGDPTGNEAQTALTMAHKIMKENNITEEEI